MTEESLSATSSEESLLEELQGKREALKWSNAVLAVLLQQAGGVVELTKEDLESIDLNKLTITATYVAARDIYVVEGEFE